LCIMVQLSAGLVIKAEKDWRATGGFKWQCRLFATFCNNIDIILRIDRSTLLMGQRVLIHP